MRWSIKLGRVAGIRIFIHWTFLILVGYFFFADLDEGVPAALRSVVFVLALFVCIVLHELGHALAARRYGIETRDITLLPIGGVARMERMPRDPGQELVVALAGPAVNVVIALSVGALLLGLDTAGVVLSATMMRFLYQFLAVNLFLVAFNLLPAFPMDGGRVLRALLARRLEYVRATWIAARIGQVMALLFVVAGIIAPQPMLAIIGIVIFFGARNEAWIAEMTARHPEFDLERALRPNYTVRG
jgi:Zn-dependent protease